MEHKQLARALRDCAEQVMGLRDALGDADADEYHHQSRVLGDSHTLLRVLASVAAGKPLLKAMGAPGDWGRDTPIGQALIVALQEHGSAAEATELRQLREYSAALNQRSVDDAAEIGRLRECLKWLQERHQGGLMRAKIDEALGDKASQASIAAGQHRAGVT